MATVEEPVHDDVVGGFIARHGVDMLSALLVDRTTGRNIIWADDEYISRGAGFDAMDEIVPESITGANAGLIRTRAQKAAASQSQRTRTRAEVFTPSWLCNRMNNDLDREWFRHDVFTAADGTSWTVIPGPVKFPKTKGHGWHAYVESLRLEITCGEAPFICSRYDTVTGEPIPIRDRIGFLDRKLRVITERTKRNADWMTWAFKALTATYGYEYQGDNLLLARINVFETMCEHYAERWGEEPPDDAKRRMADIISWNLWQMDGLTNAVPTDAVETATHSVLTTSADKEPLILFNMEETSPQPLIRSSPRCLIYDWEQGKPMEFAQLGGLAA